MGLSRISRLFVSALLLLVVSACSSGRGDRNRASSNPNALFEQATEFQAAGNCTRAIAIYYALAYRGTGFQDAQYRLGKCLIEEAGNGHELTDYLEGVVWQRRAAETGWAEAQGALIVAYLEGPDALRDPEEAALWLALYSRNPGRKQVGFQPLPEGTLAHWKSLLTAEQIAAGEDRASTWQTSLWQPPRMATGDRRARPEEQRRPQRQGDRTRRRRQ